MPPAYKNTRLSGWSKRPIEHMAFLTGILERERKQKRTQQIFRSCNFNSKFCPKD